MNIIFAGTPAFAVASLQALLDSEHHVCAVYTQPDRPAGRGRLPQSSPVKQLARQRGIRVFQPHSLKTPEEVAQFSALQADLLVVVAYGMILSQTILDVPPLGCINVHGSLLPRWRGAAPIQRAIMAGDSHTGVTIMNMVKQLDAGAMLHKIEYAIKDSDNAGDVHDALALLGAQALREVLPALAAGKLHGIEQDASLVTYADKLYKSEADIDWQHSAVDIARQIRAFNPYPVAQTHYLGQVLRLWQAEPVDTQSTGEVGLVRVQHKQLQVQTGNGSLLVQQVQLPNGKRISASEFLNAHAIDGVVLA